MATPSFDQIWEAIKGLDAEKQQRLRSLLDVLLARRGVPLTEKDEVELALLKDGTLDSIPPSTPDQSSFDNWKPVTIEGKPLSETIIEERR
jgi:hypothetical protein